MKKLSAEKQFGFLASILSLLLMLFFYSRGSEIYFWLFFVFAITLSSLTLFAPKRLIVLSNLWMRLGLNLSILINPFIIILVYVLTIVPVSVFLRLFKFNLLHTKFDEKKETYWERRTEQPGPFDRQY